MQLKMSCHHMHSGWVTTVVGGTQQLQTATRNFLVVDKMTPPPHPPHPPGMDKGAGVDMWGHEATDTELAHAPVSQAYGHRFNSISALF